MSSTPLSDLHEHIELLSSETGEYYVVCARTGERPVPVAGRRFATRAIARDAAQVAELYRAALRRYDSRVAVYDLVVCQEHSNDARLGREQAQGEVA